MARGRKFVPLRLSPLDFLLLAVVAAFAIRYVPGWSNGVLLFIVAAIGIPILERTSQLQKLALANWDSNDFAAFLPPRVAQFRVDLQLIAARLQRFVGHA